MKGPMQLSMEPLLKPSQIIRGLSKPKWNG